MDPNPMSRVYLRHAYEEAMSKSHDKHTQVGAILVHDTMGIVSSGANRICNNIEIDDSKLEYPDKKTYMEHAERNAIFLAAERGASTKGLVMYCPWFSCLECSRAIIQSGIRRVVGHKQIHDITPERWKESIEKGHGLLREAGVEMEMWSGKIGNGIEIMFNGKPFQP